MTNKQITAAFAKQTHTKAMAWSLYIQDGVIYSYGPHFPLAIRLHGRVYMNTDKYSRTTSKHQSQLRFALRLEDIDPIPCTTEEIKKLVSLQSV